MAEVEIYTATVCPYCTAAKRLLKEKGVAFTEHNLDVLPESEAQRVAQLSGRTSVPQVFINGKSIGGYTDLKQMEADGKLDGLLAEAPPAA